MKNQEEVSFADRILTGLPVALLAGQDPNKESLLAQYSEILRKNVEGAIVVKADEIAQYYYTHKEEKDGGAPSIFPNLAIPFERCFVEFKPHSAFGRPRAGCLFHVQRLDRKEDAQAHLSSHPAWAGLKVEWLTSNYSGEDPLFHVSVDGILMSRHEAMTPCVTSHFFVTKNGGLAIKQIVSQLVGFRDEIGNSQEATLQFYLGLILPAALTFSFMNCRNVRTIDHEPKRTLSKRHQNRFGRPLLSYKTLEIEAMKRALETEGAIKHNGIRKALHICQGHFATYTPEKGMMGRPLSEPVTVWKPAHVRGGANMGMGTKN